MRKLVRDSFIYFINKKLVINIFCNCFSLFDFLKFVEFFIDLMGRKLF